MSAAAKTLKVDYPTSDGKPMAETDLHRDQMVDAIQTLQHRYRERTNVYVSGNLLIFYEPGNKRKHVAPDTFVVFGVPKRKRLNYLTWEEGKSPDVLIEITSKSTKREDIVTKKTIYRDKFKAKEYILFDPTGDYIEGQLQGWRRVRGQWKEMPVHNGKLYCATLGLELHVDGTRLRFFDPETQQYLANPEERAEAEKERADTEKERAAAERRRAEAERRRAEQAEAERIRVEQENERLRREIEALRRGRPAGGE
ncbi:MAG: Uma2 family endonuclease [Gemmataceae bacterium]